jgi:hypothetical protein
LGHAPRRADVFGALVTTAGDATIVDLESVIGSPDLLPPVATAAVEGGFLLIAARPGLEATFWAPPEL